jgi:hypothetical protein
MRALTVLLPPLRRIVGDASNLLAYWYSKGDHDPAKAAGRDAMLRECFEFIGTEIPVAALTRSVDSTDSAGSWLRADPCHVAPDAVAVRMLACGNLDLSTTEAEDLARSLQPLFGDAGFALEPTTADRWYLRCPPGTQLPLFDPPEAVLGDDLSRHLPAGDVGKRWRYLLNEAQVTLHNHPVNAARARRGLPTANSLWFWGAGKLPDWVRTRYSRIFSDDKIVVGLSRLAKKAVGGPVADVSKNEGDVLLDFGSANDNVSMEPNGLASIDEMFRHRQIDSVLLMFANGERVRFKRSHRWRFWRSVRLPPT